MMIDDATLQNALDEAESRGDEFNARQFRANLEKPQQADKDSAEEYRVCSNPDRGEKEWIITVIRSAG